MIKSSSAEVGHHINLFTLSKEQEDVAQIDDDFRLTIRSQDRFILNLIPGHR